MKRLATVTSLLLAFAGAASAQPWYGNAPRPAPVDRDQHPYDRDRPYDRGVDEGMRGGDEGTYGRGWSVLGEAYVSGTDRQAINLDLPRGQVDRIRIQATRGAPYIHRVMVEFGNGRWRTFRVERALNHTLRDSFDIPVRGRNVRRVMVFTEPDPSSAYRILGRR